MARATVNGGIELEYDTFGSEGDPAVVCISGLGAQLITYHEDFCTRLAERGYFVIRHDNRDVGLSTKIEDGSSYTLSDMAADTVGLLDALGIDAAHVVCVSMGGMIAQAVAIEHPTRVRSLTSYFTSNGVT